MDTTFTIILMLVGLVVVGSVLIWYWQRQRSMRLRTRFGPEYERIRAETGDVRRAEAELAARERRVEKFHIRPLTLDEAERFGDVWRHTQVLFVDDPKGAATEADQLVTQVMSARGYPMADFEQRAADVSVDHPAVVSHYREARVIAERNRAGTASTEDLRQALIHYRALFEELLEQKRADLQHAPARR
jgi:hypothetical protein